MTFFAGHRLGFQKYLPYDLFIVSSIFPSIVGCIMFNHGHRAVVCSSFRGSRSGFRAEDKRSALAEMMGKRINKMNDDQHHEQKQD